MKGFFSRTLTKIKSQFTSGKSKKDTKNETMPWDEDKEDSTANLYKKVHTQSKVVQN